MTRASAPAGGPSAIILVAAQRPASVVDNDEVAARLGTTAEWIVSRHVAGDGDGDGESTLDLASEAAVAAAGLAGGDVDCAIVATITHLVQTPTCAPLVADRLGSRAPALDLSAACAGYCYAVQLAVDMVKAGTAGHVFLLADGAGAAVVARVHVGPAVTSAASIPLPTHATLKKNPYLAGELALQGSFGAGLAYAVHVVRLPEAVA